MHAAAGNHQWMLRVSQQIGGAFDMLGVRHHPVQRPATKPGAAVAVDGGWLVEQIHRHQKHRGAGPAGGGGGDRHVHVVIDTAGQFQPSHPFRDAGEQRHVVQFLERVAFGGVARHILHQRHNRDGRLQRLRQWGHQQGGGRAVLRGYHANPPTRAGVAVRHHATGILGAIGNLANAELGCCEINRRRDRLAEHHVHPVSGERRGESGGDGGVLTRGEKIVAHGDANALSSFCFQPPPAISPSSQAFTSASRSASGCSQ